MTTNYVRDYLSKTGDATVATWITVWTFKSYWPEFGGGFQAKDRFIEAMKDLIDRVHSWYTDQDEIFPLHLAAKIIRSIKFYDSMVIIERKDSDEPPVSIAARNGQVFRSRKILETRNRKSIF